MKRYWVRVGAEVFEVEMDALGGTVHATIGGAVHRVELTELVPSWYTLIVDGTVHDLVARDVAGSLTVNLDGQTCFAQVDRARRAGPDDGFPASVQNEDVRSPMPGLVLAVHVKEGSQVEMGQALAIMEAMKMQMEIRAPHAGTVTRVHVGPGQEIAAGQLLVTMG